MSVAAMRQIKWVTHTPTGKKLNAAEKGVLMQLADDHNEDSGVAWPSVANLAARVPLSAKQCRRVLQALEKEKAIESRPRLREDVHVRRSNEYRFWFDPPFDAASSAKTEKRLRLQAARAAARPVQLRIEASASAGGEFGTPAHGSTPLPPMGVPPSHPWEYRTPTGGST